MELKSVIGRMQTLDLVLVAVFVGCALLVVVYLAMKASGG